MMCARGEFFVVDCAFPKRRVNRTNFITARRLAAKDFLRPKAKTPSKDDAIRRSLTLPAASSVADAHQLMSRNAFSHSRFSKLSHTAR
jgi:hypothetical protein